MTLTERASLPTHARTTFVPVTAVKRARDAAAAAYIAATARFTGLDRDHVDDEPGAARFTAREPFGSVVLAFGPGIGARTVCSHIAAARAAGNSVAVLLTSPVSDEIDTLCEGIEYAAGPGPVHRLRDGDPVWQRPSSERMVAVVTEGSAASGHRTPAALGGVVGDTALFRFSSRSRTVLIPVETVPAPAQRRRTGS